MWEKPAQVMAYSQKTNNKEYLNFYFFFKLDKVVIFIYYKVPQHIILFSFSDPYSVKFMFILEVANIFYTKNEEVASLKYYSVLMAMR